MTLARMRSPCCILSRCLGVYSVAFRCGEVPLLEDFPPRTDGFRGSLADRAGLWFLLASVISPGCGGLPAGRRLLVFVGVGPPARALGDGRRRRLDLGLALLFLLHLLEGQLEALAQEDFAAAGNEGREAEQGHQGSPGGFHALPEPAA